MTTLIYSPISKNVEAGPTSRERPNAVVLHGGVASCIAAAVGGSNSDGIAEVGNVALDSTKVQEIQEDLKANPPKPFDITRRLNVFSSMVQYVEFSASNYRLTTRQIPLPPELATPDNIRAALKRTASDLFSSAVAFEPPVVKVLYKNVSPENIRDPAFLDALKASIHKRKVPPEIINSLFESGQVAPETGKFAGR